MPTAGFCSKCQKYVWLSPQGDCQFGHPSSLVHSVYSAQPAEEAHPAKQGRAWIPWAILGIATLALAGLVAGVFGVAGHLLRDALQTPGSAGVTSATSDGAQGGLFGSAEPAIPDEWRARAQKDYPDWRLVGFESFDLGTYDTTETDYIVRMEPPGRDFSVGLMYVSRQGHEPFITDEILRPSGPKHDLSASLLDYLEHNYVEQDKIVDWVESEANGDAYVTWSHAASNDDGGVDELVYNVKKGWVLLR